MARGEADQPRVAPRCVKLKPRRHGAPRATPIRCTIQPESLAVSEGRVGTFRFLQRGDCALELGDHVREVVDCRRDQRLHVDVPVAVDDAVAQPGGSTPRDLRVRILRPDGTWLAASPSTVKCHNNAERRMPSAPTCSLLRPSTNSRIAVAASRISRSSRSSRCIEGLCVGEDLLAKVLVDGLARDEVDPAAEEGRQLVLEVEQSKT